MRFKLNRTIQSQSGQTLVGVAIAGALGMAVLVALSSKVSQYSSASGRELARANSDETAKLVLSMIQKMLRTGDWKIINSENSDKNTSPQIASTIKGNKNSAVFISSSLAIGEKTPQGGCSHLTQFKLIPHGEGTSQYCNPGSQSQPTLSLAADKSGLSGLLNPADSPTGKQFLVIGLPNSRVGDETLKKSGKSLFSLETFPLTGSTIDSHLVELKSFVFAASGVPTGLVVTVDNAITGIVPLESISQSNENPVIEKCPSSGSGLCGYTFADMNSNGKFDSWEVPYSTVVILTGTDVNGNQVNRRARSDENGRYGFGNVVYGHYTLTSYNPSVFREQSPFVGSSLPGAMTTINSITNINYGIPPSTTPTAIVDNLNFRNLGLKLDYISGRCRLASTPPSTDKLKFSTRAMASVTPASSYIFSSCSEAYVTFDEPGWNGTINAILSGNSGACLRVPSKSVKCDTNISFNLSTGDVLRAGLFFISPSNSYGNPSSHTLDLY